MEVPKAALMHFDAAPSIGQVIWSLDPVVKETEAFVRAKVVEVKSSSEIVIVREGAEGGHVLTVPLRSCWPCNEFSASAEGDADDVAQLTHQHEPGLLDNLRSRFVGEIRRVDYAFVHIKHNYQTPPPRSRCWLE